MTPNNVPAAVPNESPDAFASDLLRGHTDTIVLGVLRATDRYGFEIYKTIRDATDGKYEIKEATLYATFRRLVKDGLVEAYWGDETQGGRRKYYRITDAGPRRLPAERARLDGHPADHQHPPEPDPVVPKETTMKTTS